MMHHHSITRALENVAMLMCLVTLGFSLNAATISLEGDWAFQLDPKDQGISNRWWQTSLDDTIRLPSTTAREKKGNPLQLEPKLDKTSLQHLHQKYSYIGPAWHSRTVDVPADWKGKDVELSLERVIWETRVWVNGTEIGTQDSLSTPHRFDVTRALRPGANKLVIRVDNRKKLEIGVGHAYTEETQTIWNGMVGKLVLEARDKVRIEHVDVKPDISAGTVAVTISTHNGTDKAVQAQLVLEAEAANFEAKSASRLKRKIRVAPGDGVQTIVYPMGKRFEKWSEFNPKFYAMRVAMSADGDRSEVRTTFGMREVTTSGRHIFVNGNRTFLRGTLECCIFPESAHPAMEEPKWEKIFSTMKEYGLNHVRFHSWCPPDAAFRVADRYGIYIQVELPNWSFKMGQAPDVDAFFRAEGERIICEFAHHPSWVMFSMGNELVGDFAKIDELVAHLRTLAPGLLFTSTSYSFAQGGSPRGLLPGPKDDYFISMETKSGWVRGQGFLNQTKPNTVSDYAEGLSCLSIPLVSHEVGQYNVYPNLAELPKYEAGPLRSLGYEAIQNDLKAKGRLNEAPRYTRDSGKLAALLYKEDVERALRTKDQAGIALLDLHDFPGQSTATVGLLDAFWDSKGLITPEQFRRFCSPTVPLVRMAKMVFENSETFEAGVEIAHFGPEPIRNAVLNWKLAHGSQVIGHGSFQAAEIPLGNGTQVGKITQKLSSIDKASELKLTIEVKGMKAANDWSVWVYPAAGSDNLGDIALFEALDEPLFQALREGKKALLLPPRAGLKMPIDGRFIPVFWSPLHFPNQPGTLGATIEPNHPVWRDFPTATHTDWQWWELLSKSYAVNLDAMPVKPTMPFRFVDKYDRNALPAGIFEVQVGEGKLLVCTLDISSLPSERIAARQLRRSILAYMNSTEFKPSIRWDEATLKSLASDARFTVTASSASASFQPEMAVDGDSKTFWHTDWDHGSALPARFDLDLRNPGVLNGFEYVPRQDMRNGRIGSYAVEVSLDGKKWMKWLNEGQFPDTKEKQTVRFEKPIKARFLRLIARTDLGGSGNAAISELIPLINETTTDVSDLGIVPGFNDVR